MGKVWLIDRTNLSRERMYLTHEAKGHEIPVALGNTVAMGGPNATGVTNSLRRAWKPRSVQIGPSRGHRGRCCGTIIYGACGAPRGSSRRTWGPSC